MDKIIKLLLDVGFIRMADISTPGGHITRIAGNRFTASSVNIRKKFKYPRGNIRVTVGARTVSFYKVHNKRAFDFINYKTSELGKIKFTVREIQNRFC